MKNSGSMALANRYRLIAELFFCILFFCFVYHKSGFWFETNDDQAINDIFSGLISGHPETHTMYTSILISAPMAFLYRMLPGIPWWGGFLLVLSFFGVIVTLDALLSKSESFRGQVLSCVSFFSILLTTWYMRARVQFTSTAMLLALAGFVAVLFYSKKRGCVIFAICELLAYAVRPRAMEIIQPIGFCLLVGCFCLKKEEIRDLVKKIALPFVIFVSIVLIGMISDGIAYGSKEWKNALEYRDANDQIQDYTGFVAYENIEGLTEEDVSKEEYEANFRYLILDYEKLTSTLKKAATVSKNNYQKPSISETVKWVLIGSYSNNTQRWMIVVLLFYFIALAVYKRKLMGSLLFLIAYITGKLVSWGFLYQNGRMPYRIMFPLYYSEVLALGIGIFVLVTVKEKETERKIRYVKTFAMVLFCGMILFLGIRAGRFWINDLSSDKVSYPIIAGTETKISDYCKEDVDNRYIVSNFFYSNSKRRVLDAGPSEVNYVYSGGWFSCIPSVKAHLEEYLKGGEVFYITTVDETAASEDYELLYLKQHYNFEPKLVDSFILDTNVEAFVYRVR